MLDPSDDTTPITPPRDPANDTALMSAKGARPQHAVSSDTPGIGRGGWWAITIAAAAWLIFGFLLAFGPARYWTPVPAVFLGYFVVSGVIGLVFWKGVRELQDSDPNLRTDDPAPTGQRVAAAIGAVGIAAAVILLPAGLSSAPANALPCPDGSNTCGPTAPTQDQPTQGNGGNTTAPQAPNTTIPPNVDTGLPQAPTQGNGNGFQGTVQQMPTPDKVDPNSCILNCPTQQAPQTGQANPPQTGQQQAPQTGQNPVTTAPNTPATTPQAPTSTPKLRTPTPETTTSSKQRDNDDDQQRSGDENRDKNSGIPYQAAELAALAGTYRRRKLTKTAARDGQAVAENTTRVLLSKPVQGTPTPTPGPADGGWTGNPGKGPDSQWRLTAEQVQKIMPNASRKNIDKYLPYLNELVTAIDGWKNKKRTAALLAMITVETGSLSSMNEIDPPAALGNYFGRGFIQLTGKWGGGEGNYGTAQEALGLPLVSNPELAADPHNSVAITAWFWLHNPTLGSGVSLNTFADKMTSASDLASVTRGIYGSVEYSELVEKAAEKLREAAWTRAMGVL